MILKQQIPQQQKSWPEDKGSCEIYRQIGLCLVLAPERGCGRYLRTNAGNAHQALAIGFALADQLDLVCGAFDPLVEPKPVFIKADNDIAHARGYLVLAVLQDGVADIKRDKALIHDQLIGFPRAVRWRI